MKIWCFLCFGEEEGDETKIISKRVDETVSMSDDAARDWIEAVRNDDNFDGFELGFLPWEVDGFQFGLGLGPERGLEDVERVENEGLVNVISGEIGNESEVNAGALEVLNQLGSNCNQGMLETKQHSRFSDGASSSSTSLLSSLVDRGNCHRDLHNKRPKVHSFSLDWGSRFDSAPIHSVPVCNNKLLDPGSSKNAEVIGEVSVQAEDIVHMDLTDDLLHMVFSFLDHEDLCRASVVCHQWRTAGSHEDFWRKFNFNNKKITPEQFGDMCHRYPNAMSVNLCDTPSIQSLAMKAVSFLRNLEDLSLGKGQLGETFFQALTECRNLKNLTISDAILGNGIQEIPIYHDRLCHLQILKCRVLRVSIRCPLLEALSLKRSTMPHVVLNTPLLHELDIASCHKLSDAAIRSAAISCPLLESLDMANCSCVSDETLREIALTCGNLHILDASYCPNISLESVRLSMLTVLKLHSCEGITSASIAAISHSYALEILELDNCSLLTSVSLDLPHLKNIRLVHCRKFVDLNLRSSMLSSITVSNCPALQRINITSNTLRKLVLQKQESLTTLTLQCQCLQEVDLTECEALTNCICEVFSDGGGCPSLKSLVLDSCESLTRVSFCSSSLINLSLAGCRAIMSLVLKCPFLEQVSLDGCDHLEKASFCPVGLKSLNLGICPKLNQLQIEALQLASLELKGCGVLSEASIHCPYLMSLDASFCSQLKDDCLIATASKCSLIESLILMSCPSVGSDGLLSLQWLPNLTYLDLSYTFLVDLHPVFKSCESLKVLKLQACKYLVDCALEPLYKEGALPALCELDLSYGTLSQLAIEELLACCTHLTHVSLNGCVNMHDLNWNFRADQVAAARSVHSPSNLSMEDIQLPNEQPTRMLEHLNCVGCPNVKKVMISSAAHCLYLSSFNLSLSAYLKEVDIACSNLCFLNLSNCCFLEILKLKCPRLSSLFLQSCNIGEEAVEAAISSCSMLETLDVRFCSKIYPSSMAKLRAACPNIKRIFSSLTPS